MVAKTAFLPGMERPGLVLRRSGCSLALFLLQSRVLGELVNYHFRVSGRSGVRHNEHVERNGIAPRRCAELDAFLGAPRCEGQALAAACIASCTWILVDGLAPDDAP